MSISITFLSRTTPPALRPVESGRRALWRVAPVLVLFAISLQTQRARADGAAVDSGTTKAFVVQCAGCSATQMQQKAAAQPVLTGGDGFAFVYDMGAATMRKYYIYWDNSCGAPASPGSGRPETEGASPNPESGCIFTKYADPMTPVDSGVASVFSSMNWIYANERAYWNTNTIIVDISNLGPDPTFGDNRPFDPRQIAWDYPNGSYFFFVQSLESMLHDEEDAELVDPGLAYALYGIQLPSISGLQIQAPTGSYITLGLNLDFQVRGNTKVEFCDEGANCAYVTVGMASGGVTISYTGSYDGYGQPFPSPIPPKPGSPLWSWHHQGGFEPFSGWLRQQNVFVPSTGDGCDGAWTNLVLTCTWQGHKLVGCTVECY